MPKPISPRVRRQLKAAKLRAEKLKRMATASREGQAFTMCIKKLPPPVRALLELCGIGKVIKKPERISYSKLRKVIASKHPVDPQTFEKFEVTDSVTVSDYGMKLTDACGCSKIYACFAKAQSKVKKFVQKKRDKGITKPESMKDVPDDQNKDSFEGLSKAAIYVGEGPIMYLQIMKTLGIMCTLLTIINFPLLMLYSSTSGRVDVNFFNVNSMFTHFHLGNIGRNEYIC